MIVEVPETEQQQILYQWCEDVNYLNLQLLFQCLHGIPSVNQPGLARFELHLVQYYSKLPSEGMAQTSQAMSGLGMLYWYAVHCGQCQPRHAGYHRMTPWNCIMPRNSCFFNLIKKWQKAQFNLFLTDIKQLVINPSVAFKGSQVFCLLQS